MDIIEVAGKVYGVVITQDDAGAEVGLWCADEQVAAIMIEDDGKIFSMPQTKNSLRRHGNASRKPPTKRSMANSK